MVRLAPLTMLAYLLPAHCSFASTQVAPSFDCAKAATSVEHAICAYPRLASADKALAVAYAAASAIAGPALEDLRTFERAWLRRRGTVCGFPVGSGIVVPDAGQLSCLLALIQDRASSLQAPYYGYASNAYPDVALQPPFTYWLLQEAFREMPFAPGAAQQVFARVDADTPGLGRLMVLRLFGARSARNRAAQQALAKALGRTHRPIDLPPYDGTVAGLVPYMQEVGAGLVLPCRLFELYPDLIPATGGAFGGVSDNFVPSADCNEYEYPLPSGQRELATLAGAYDGGAFGRCTGTLRFYEFAQDRMYELLARVAPRLLLQRPQPAEPGHAVPRRFAVPLVADDLPLENWGYLSVWNRHQFLGFKPAFDRAAAETAAMYRAHWKMSAAEAARAAHVALWLPLLWTGLPPPLPLIVALMTGAKIDLQAAPAAMGAPARSDAEPLLSLAVEYPDGVRALLAARADPNAGNAFGKTPLMTAAQFDRLDTIGLLVGAGAAVNAQSAAPSDIAGNDTSTGPGSGCGAYTIRHGRRTALMYAAASGGLPTIRALLAAGGSIRLTDSTGLTALDYLLGHGPVPANPRLTSSDRAEAVRLLEAK